MRRLALSVAFLCAIDATPARGAHCPLGQLYRVHLRTCVGLNTALARPFKPVLTRDHRRGARNAPATIPTAPRGDPPDLADAIDAALLIPLLEAAAERWRASVAPVVQLYPESGPWPPLSPCCDQ
jgi:hypothetical protein